MSVSGSDPYEAIAIALKIPPNIPGIPWRLWTPQVSLSPIHYSSFDCKYLNPRQDTTPAKSPIQRAPAGLVNTPLGAPMTTPPAKDAFKISSIENFYLTKEVIIKVPKQLPVNEMIVLATMTLF